MILRAPYPNHETRKEVVIASSMAGILFYLLLITYQPFGTSEFEHPLKYLLLLPYGISIIFSFFSVSLLQSRGKKNWTVGSELIKNLLVLSMSAILSFMYNSLFWSQGYLSIENLLNQFAHNSALGLPVCALYLMGRYIYLTPGSQAAAKTGIKDNPFLAGSLRNSEIKKPRTAKLRVKADYSNSDLIIKVQDFVYAEAADNYCVIHYYEKDVLKKHMIRISLTRLLSQIQADGIKKIHRSYIVNLEHVASYKGNSNGYKIALTGTGKELKISRNYIDPVIPVLKTLVACP